MVQNERTVEEDESEVPLPPKKTVEKIPSH